MTDNSEESFYKKKQYAVWFTINLMETLKQFISHKWPNFTRGLISAEIERYVKEGLEREMGTHAHKTTVLREAENKPNWRTKKKGTVLDTNGNELEDNAIVLSNNGNSITTDLADSYLDKIEDAKHRKHLVKISMILAYLRKENKIGLIEGNEALVYKMDFVKGMRYVYPRCTDDRTVENQLNILLTDKEIEVVPGKGLAVYRIIHISEMTT
jgi:hypothetical protein